MALAVVRKRIVGVQQIALGIEELEAPQVQRMGDIPGQAHRPEAGRMLLREAMLGIPAAALYHALSTHLPGFAHENAAHEAARQDLRGFPGPLPYNCTAGLPGFLAMSGRPQNQERAISGIERNRRVRAPGVIN